MAYRHLDQAIESFARQFEPEGDAFVFRRLRGGAPIPVSASERDGFIADFRRRFRRLVWGYAGALLVAILLVSIFAPSADGETDNWWIYGVVAVTTIPLIILSHRLWGAPARQLGRRTAVGKERSRSEVKRLMLSEMSWGQLVATVVSMPIVLILFAGDRDIWHGWGLLWPVFVGAVTLALLYQLFRKWQISAGGD